MKTPKHLRKCPCCQRLRRHSPSSQFPWLMRVCSHHEGRWGRKNGSGVHVSLEAPLVKVPGRRWLRELWYVCPGTPEDWDGKGKAGT